jgi:hypothetical protein
LNGVRQRAREVGNDFVAPVFQPQQCESFHVREHTLLYKEVNNSFQKYETQHRARRRVNIR